MSTLLYHRVAIGAPHVQPRVLLCVTPAASNPSPALFRLSRRPGSERFQYRPSRICRCVSALQVRHCADVGASCPQRPTVKAVQASGASDVVIRPACAEECGALSTLLESAGAVWYKEELEVSIISCVST